MSENKADHDPAQAEAEQLVLSESPTRLASVVQNAARGVELTPQELGILSDMGRIAASRDPSLQISISQTTMTSGLLPPASELNAYDDEARKFIYQTVEREQQSAHYLRKNGQNGMIWKDRLGQIFGFLIAIIALLVAAYISQFSAWAAAIIGTIDLLGMVSVFAAPRLYEKYLELKANTPPQSPTKQRPKGKRRN